MTLVSAALEAPFRLGSALRGGRVFHPRGVTFEGSAELDSPWWPQSVPRRSRIFARLSRGIGTPDGFPDVLGLAIRLPVGSASWDLLLATAYLPGRAVLLPARSWSSARYSTLMAYRTALDSVPRWIAAVPEGEQPSTTTSVRALTAPLTFSLRIGTILGEWEPAGRVVLEQLLPESDDAQPSFDPAVHHPNDAELWPGWLGTARRDAYRGSRAGRGAPQNLPAVRPGPNPPVS